ncbi:MAG: endonuclease/exonuclease/phosphatase family protein [Phycisphaerales bacterium]|nr:endonuclease/exonuclease/phosphatase family protein [Phycisphaerales bacterium]
MNAKSTMLLTFFVLLISLACSIGYSAESQPVALRIAVFNIEDVRSSDLETADNERLKQITAIIQRMRPNIILLSELALRQDDTTSNADRFIESYLSISQGDGLEPIDFISYTPASNTGIHSGHDLDHSGTLVSESPEQTQSQTTAGRAFGGDSFGFGTFPGQYSMALLVNPKLTIQIDQIRTFQKFLWKDLPDHTAPTNPDGSPWYTENEWADFRLASKTFADVPILLPNGSVLHALISHPTPPAFDGPEGRNKHRNHDEIKLIRDYIDNNQKLYDDQGELGGLEPGSTFVILGDLNADPTDGSSLDMVMLTQLLTSPKLAEDVFPSSEIKVAGLDSTDTSHFRLRVDYVLPSSDVTITNSGVWRIHNAETDFPSDHYPVWIEAIIP